jgi:hypothetical protein
MPNRYRNTIAAELLCGLTRLVVRAPEGSCCWRLEDPAPDGEPELLYIEAGGRTWSVSLEEIETPRQEGRTR